MRRMVATGEELQPAESVGGLQSVPGHGCSCAVHIRFKSSRQAAACGCRCESQHTIIVMMIANSLLA